MKEFFGKLWKGLKFAFSATIGLPCACAATCILGVAYLLAEATNIVEAKVRKDIFGIKQVAKSPFFESVAKGLKSTLKSVWKDYGVYSHLALLDAACGKSGRQELYDPTKENDINPINETSVETPKENLEIEKIEKKIEEKKLPKQVNEETPVPEVEENLSQNQQSQKPSIKETKENLLQKLEAKGVLKEELENKKSEDLVKTIEPKIPLYSDIVMESPKPSQENFQPSFEPSSSPKVTSAKEVEPQNNQQVLAQ
jgi:hypothetical protein